MTYDKYIGLPYLFNGRTEAGVDCWGLVRLFYRDELNIDLPSYIDSCSGPNDPAITAMMDEFKDVNWKKQTTPEVGDVCVFNIYGEPCHVGVYIGNSKFMHSREGRDVVIESLDSPKWSKRLEGCYKPDSSKQINVVGAPHPLKTSVYRDWTVAGTTVRDFVNFTKEKYKVSDRLSNRLRVVVDGKEILAEQWDTTVLEQGQTIAYRSVPEGRDSLRMVLMIALIVVANVYGAELGAAMGLTETVATDTAYGTTFTTQVTTTGRIVGTMAINMAGMALMNAVFPIRPPSDNSAVGRGLNMFTGASNQVNKFGAIPVVLGKVRMTGIMGATPYIETTTDTSIINLLIVWGFGPLQISDDDICVGLTPLRQFYSANQPETVPKYITLKGTPNEDSSELNKLYPSNIEQKILQVELKNNTTDGVNWVEYRFKNKAEALSVGLSFPEGMREVNNKGDINEAISGIEIQVAKHDPNSSTTIPEANWQKSSPYSVGYWAGVTSNPRAYVYPLVASRNYSTLDGQSLPLYQYITFAVSPGGGIQHFEGTATANQYADPSNNLKAQYLLGSFAGLISTNTSSYSRLPNIPNGYVKLYTLCTYNGSVISTENHLTSSPYTSTGLALTLDVVKTVEDGQEYPTGVVNVIISSGKVWVETGAVPLPGETQTIFTSSQFTGVTRSQTYRTYCSLLNTYGIWPSASEDSTTMDITKTVNFPYSGYYYFEAAADDFGYLYVNNNLVLDIPGFSEATSGLIYLEAGNYPVQLKANNAGGGLKAAACKITYTSNSGLNALNSFDTGVNLYFGSAGFFSKRKDAFNFTYRINALPHDYYAVRIRRTTDDTAQPTTDVRKYFKSLVFDVTGYSNQDDAGNQLPPLTNPPGCYLAKTAIRAQSTNKINGSIDGVNAMVQTMAPVWNKVTKTWSFGSPRATNNPASLFIYVLMHPANAYRIEDIDKYTSINLATIGDWYEYCNGTNIANMVFTYNDVLTGTRSVMEVLRDICAAGMASPAFIDGRWSVIIDRPRAYTSQYFTTHNSWGFESTKLLPKIPDGFRVSYPNEAKAYQQDEIIIYNYGKDKSNAKVFESLNLPGITNTDQVKYFAKWHLAQLKLRPEVYTLNVDFEYLVCTRGDLVKVSHDVPKWGISSGRISSIIDSTHIKLNESVYLEVGKQYSILIRTNSVNSTTKVLQGTTKSLSPIAVSGLYDVVVLSSALVYEDNVESDNLYMLGEVGKEVQELVVVGIEPMTNISAKLTLVDYSPSIYTTDATATLLSYSTNITGENIPLIQGSIQYPPVISSITSDTSMSQLIAKGTYQNTLLIGFSNPPDLTKSAEKVQVQVIPSSATFVDGSLENITTVNKEISSVIITGLITGGLYKIRARYINSSGSIVGPWSTTSYTKNIGKTANYFTPDSVSLILQGTTLIATPSAIIMPDDFNTYEFRFIQGNTASTDFWSLDVAANNIKVVQSRTSARLNIKDFPTPRISFNGIRYRVACRALDNNNNYSLNSVLGYKNIKTIV